MSLDLLDQEVDQIASSKLEEVFRRLLTKQNKIGKPQCMKHQHCLTAYTLAAIQRTKVRQRWRQDYSIAIEEVLLVAEEKWKECRLLYRNTFCTCRFTNHLQKILAD